MKIEEEIKQYKFRNSQQKAVINLLYTTNWLLGKQKEIFQPHNITGQQYNILRILRGQYPNSISATEIKARMLDKNSDVSRLLDRLLAKKIISKQVSNSDKRAADIYLTEEGLQLLNSIDEKQHLLDSILELSEEDATTLSNLLDKCRG